jgi:hypothetical protein
MPALDILIKNNSDVPNGISHLHISFGQSGPPLHLVAYTTYLLNGSLDITTGEMSGFTKTLPLNKEPSRPFSGKLIILPSGEWSINVVSSVREEVPPNTHGRVVVVLPVEMKIVRSKPSSYEFPGMDIGKPIKQYISERPDKGFAFAKFISECGNVDVNIQVTYADGRISNKRQVIAFQRQ